MIGSTVEFLVCDQSNENFSVILSTGALYYSVKGGSNFYSVDQSLMGDRQSV